MLCYSIIDDNNLNQVLVHTDDGGVIEDPSSRGFWANNYLIVPDDGGGIEDPSSRGFRANKYLWFWDLPFSAGRARIVRGFEDHNSRTWRARIVREFEDLKFRARRARLVREFEDLKFRARGETRQRIDRSSPLLAWEGQTPQRLGTSQ